eukprot:TRINITY_DN13026_c0_g1_i1.p1 TRINITY_DN13026_c0_g1~~TRINITY_DN13026_c0_g1_i1.p1  ORF type:complete len:219 (+),score=36.36 TRINITY_DN13026_c0_g1_i1:108-764(+)
MCIRDRCNNSGESEQDATGITLERCDSHLKEYSGSFLCQQAGQLKMIWDNGYSWMNSKSLKYRVSTALSQEFENNCMMQAIAEGQKNPKMPFGCVLVQQTSGTAIATGYCNEELFMGQMWRDVLVALEKCNRMQDKVDFGDLVMYTTAEPDMMCWGAIRLYGIKRVVYGVDLATSSAILPQVALPHSALGSELQVQRFSAGLMEQCVALFSGNAVDFN